MRPKKTTSWEVKQLQKEYKQLYDVQKKTNEMIMEKINLLSEEIQNMYHAINEKYSNESKTMLEKLESISTELEQTKEFTKVLIANELLDELK